MRTALASTAACGGAAIPHSHTRSTAACIRNTHFVQLNQILLSGHSMRSSSTYHYQLIDISYFWSKTYTAEEFVQTVYLYSYSVSAHLAWGLSIKSSLVNNVFFHFFLIRASALLLKFLFSTSASTCFTQYCSLTYSVFDELALWRYE